MAISRPFGKQYVGEWGEGWRRAVAESAKDSEFTCRARVGKLRAFRYNKKTGRAEALPVSMCISPERNLHVHAAVVVVVTAAFFLLLFGKLGDHALGGQQQRRDGRGVLERAAGDLRGVDDASPYDEASAPRFRGQGERLRMKV